MTATARRDDIQRHIVGNTAPAALEAEKALLGILLSNAEAVDLIDGLLPPHMYEPLHGRLLSAILSRHAAGSVADANLLDGQFAQDEAYRRLGGMIWLQSLSDLAPGMSRAPSYAAEIRETAQRRELLKLADRVQADVNEGESSAVDIIGGVEASLLAMQTTMRKLELVSAGAASSRVLAYLDAPPEQQEGLNTGIAPLDEHLGPLLPGDLLLIMGRPGMGKSALAACLAVNMAQAGRGVIELNGEMSAEQMTRRHLTDLTQARWGAKGPKYSDIRRRQVTQAQRDMLGWADEQIRTMPLLMLKRAGLKLSQIRSIARRQAAEWARAGVPVGTLIIDHVGLVRPDQSSRDRYADQTLISNGLKELADELGCPLIALNQMNRQNENRDDKRPQTHDLRDSGSWEQDADFIIGCYREAYYAARQAEPQITKTGKAGDEQHAAWAAWDRARRSNTVEAIILKAREGESATINLWGDVARNAIRGAAPEGDLFDGQA